MSKLLSAAGLMVLMSFFSSCKKDDESKVTKTQIVKVAALISETGEWSNLGISSKAALEIAEEEINFMFDQKQLPFEFEVTFFDTGLNPSLAQQYMNTIANENFKLVIGPQSSAEVAAIKNIADSLGILVVSQGSTASSLAIPNDMIFRYVPGDQIEGSALVNTMVTQGKQAVITLARDDQGNIGLQNAVENYFENSGGQVVSLGTYPVGTTDFSSLLVSISQEIAVLNANYSLDQIAVYLASFDEATLLFEQAANYPQLATVNWYGGDGFVKNSNLLTNAAAAQFAQSTSFFCPEFGLPSYSESFWGPLVTKVYNRCGVEADAFTLAAYDALKVYALLIEQDFTILSRKTDLISTFSYLSNIYAGTTGLITLNANGDRSNGSFNYWGIASGNNGFNWTFVGQSE